LAEPESWCEHQVARTTRRTTPTPTRRASHHQASGPCLPSKVLAGVHDQGYRWTPPARLPISVHPYAKPPTPCRCRGVGGPPPYGVDGIIALDPWDGSIRIMGSALGSGWDGDRRTTLDLEEEGERESEGFHKGPNRMTPSSSELAAGPSASEFHWNKALKRLPCRLMARKLRRTNKAKALVGPSVSTAAWSSLDLCDRQTPPFGTARQPPPELFC
jgi:hypothetical protein